MRVFIADDHDLVREGLRAVLEASGHFEVIGEATTGRQVLDAAGLDEADVLILDLSLPKVQGAEVLRRLQESHPGLPVVILSMHPPEQYERPLLLAGAAAYVPKSRPTRELVDVLLKIGRDRLALMLAPAPPSGGDGDPLSTLSPREHQILVRYVSGVTVTEIAAELDVNSCTISNHLSRIRGKLAVRTNVELVHLAHRVGLVSPGPPLDLLVEARRPVL